MQRARRVALAALGFLNHCVAMVDIIGAVYFLVMHIAVEEFFWDTPYPVFTWLDAGFALSFLLSELALRLGGWTEEEKGSGSYVFFLRSLYLCKVCLVTRLVIAEAGRQLFRWANAEFLRHVA